MFSLGLGRGSALPLFPSKLYTGLSGSELTPNAGRVLTGGGRVGALSWDSLRQSSYASHSVGAADLQDVRGGIKRSRGEVPNSALISSNSRTSFGSSEKTEGSPMRVPPWGSLLPSWKGQVRAQGIGRNYQKKNRGEQPRFGSVALLGPSF